MLSVGDPAPDFELPNQYGRLTSRTEFLGRPLVVYFYSKDGSAACTRQACEIRDIWQGLKEYNASVVGISPDDTESHRSFVEEYRLPQVLLSDPDRDAIGRYEVWGEKIVKGVKKHGVVRSTFLLNEAGVIVDQWRNVDLDAQAVEILKSVADLQDR